jgi:hypothetical protein
MIALLGAALFVIAACGSERTIVSVEPAGQPASNGGGGVGGARLDLADVAAACQQSQDGPGVAIIDRDLRDSNTSVELPDCVLHLEQGADVWLNNVVITGGVLNLHDRGTEPSVNRVKLQRVEIHADALLVELNDPDDAFQAEATEIVTAQGLILRVAGTRDDSNDGGDVRLVGSSLLSTDVDAPIQILASEHSGKIRLVNTTVDTRGSLTVLAFDCEARLDGEKLDCSTAALEAELAP